MSPTSLDVLAEAAAVQSSSEETVSCPLVNAICGSRTVAIGSANMEGSSSAPHPSKELTLQLFLRLKTMVAKKATDPELKGMPPSENVNMTQEKAADVELKGMPPSKNANITQEKAENAELKRTPPSEKANITQEKVADPELKGTPPSKNANITQEKASEPELKGIPSENVNMEIAVYQPPQDGNMSQGILVEAKPRTRVTTKLTGEIFVDFEWPQEFAELKDVKLQPLDEVLRASIADRARTYSVEERLMGWRIERRERRRGPCDTYYKHLESWTTLRSTTEVVNFLMFEAGPKDKRTRKRNAGSAEKFDRKRTKRADEFTEEEVKKFYREAYENLLKYEGGNYDFSYSVDVVVASPPPPPVSSPELPSETDSPTVVIPPVVANTDQPNPSTEVVDTMLGTDTNLVGPDEKSVEVAPMGIDAIAVEAEAGEEEALLFNSNHVIIEEEEIDMDEFFEGLDDLVDGGGHPTSVDQFLVKPGPFYSGFALPKDKFL